MKVLKNSFGKEEKLCSEKNIDILYKTGTSFLNHPIVCYFLEMPEIKNSRVMVSVSKKKFKSAVDRNLVKRRMREAYRLNKSIIDKKYHLAFVYIGNELISYQIVEKSMIHLLQKIGKLTEVSKKS